LKIEVFKLQMPEYGVLEDLMGIKCASYIMMGPPALKGRADLLEFIDELIKGMISRMMSTGCAELR
jgi:hypothetical protein